MASDPDRLASEKSKGVSIHRLSSEEKRHTTLGEIVSDHLTDRAGLLIESESTGDFVDEIRLVLCVEEVGRGRDFSGRALEAGGGREGGRGGEESSANEEGGSDFDHVEFLEGLVV